MTMPENSDSHLTWQHHYHGAAALITGGLGLIGSTLAHYLARAGARVTIIDALLPLYGGNLFNIDDIQNQVQVHYADIRDQAALAQLVKGQDYIFSLAAQVSYTDSQLDPLLDLDINCRGHLLLLEACRLYNPTAKLVFTGSRMEYGRILTNPVNEDHPTSPLSIYGVHKLAGECYYRIYHQLYQIPTVSFRISNPYGPRSQMKHSKYSLINWFIRLAMEGQTIRVFGDGQQKRDYVYVEDVVRALLMTAGRCRLSGQVFNLGSGRPTRFLEMVQMVLDIVGSGRMEQVPWPANYEQIETGDYVTDYSRLQAATGWEPKVDLQEGIKRTYEYYASYRSCYW